MGELSNSINVLLKLVSVLVKSRKCARQIALFSSIFWLFIFEFKGLEVVSNAAAVWQCLDTINCFLSSWRGLSGGALDRCILNFCYSIYFHIISLAIYQINTSL